MRASKCADELGREHHPLGVGGNPQGAPAAQEEEEGRTDGTGRRRIFGWDAWVGKARATGVQDGEREREVRIPLLQQWSRKYRRSSVLPFPPGGGRGRRRRSRSTRTLGRAALRRRGLCLVEGDGGEGYGGILQQGESHENSEDGRQGSCCTWSEQSERGGACAENPPADSASSKSWPIAPTPWTGTGVSASSSSAP